MRAFLGLLALIAGPVLADELYVVPDGVETRWASPENPGGERGQGGRENGGRKGAAFFVLKAGESRTLAQVEGGSGVVRRLWMTLNDRSPKMLRGLRLEMFWDGAAAPAVSAPVGDFFGVGLGRVVPFESALFSSPEGRSFNASVPMPFRKGMRIVLTNDTDAPQPQVYYDVDYTLGDKLPADAGYLHAYFRRENPTTLQRDYEILPRVTGRGRYLGANLGVIVDGHRYGATWWGEGEVKIYLDGDRERPTLNGTGTEDYIGTGYGQGAYSHRYQGAPIADHEKQRYTFYRYHVNDPVYFHRDVRVTIQQIGFLWSNDGTPEKPVTAPLIAAGPGRRELDLKKLPNVNLFERADDWSSCVYLYLDQPGGVLPRLAPVAERLAGL
ncbi:MAG TPA: glycoside hydrolase family 172 protein [Steroidobacteraceae bacterium]|nr:glycoside hydrolase family 172 protein [Steroidobacteraceae bacterium]